MTAAVDLSAASSVCEIAEKLAGACLADLSPPLRARHRAHHGLAALLRGPAGGATRRLGPRPPAPRVTDSLARSLSGCPHAVDPSQNQCRLHIRSGRSGHQPPWPPQHTSPIVGALGRHLQRVGQRPWYPPCWCPRTVRTGMTAPPHSPAPRPRTAWPAPTAKGPQRQPPPPPSLRVTATIRSLRLRAAVGRCAAGPRVRGRPPRPSQSSAERRPDGWSQPPQEPDAHRTNPVTRDPPALHACHPQAPPRSAAGNPSRSAALEERHPCPPHPTGRT